MTFRPGAYRQIPLVHRALVIALLGIMAGTAALGLIAAHQPLLALAAALLLPCALAVMVWPGLATLAVCFILYSNVAVVAVRFHGLPNIVGSAVPVLLLVPLTHYLIFRRKQVIITRTLPLIVLFLLIQILASVFSTDVVTSIGKLATFAIEGLGLYFLVTNVVRTPEMLRRVVWVLLLAGVVMGAPVVYQQVTQTTSKTYGGFAQLDGKIVGEEEVQLRSAGPIGEQNYYAQIMLMLVPIGLFGVSGKGAGRRRPVSIAAVALITLGAMLSFSRGGAVGFGLMLVVMALMGYIKPVHIAMILLGLFLLLQAVPQFGARLVTLQRLEGVASSGAGDADDAVKGRLGEMSAAAFVFLDHPVLGVGPGMFREFYQAYVPDDLSVHDDPTRRAHNLYLEMAAETGVLGITCFMAILFITLRDLARTRKRWMQQRPDIANMATAFMLALVVYLSTGIFLSQAFIRYFWIIMALASATTFIADSKSPNKVTS